MGAGFAVRVRELFGVAAGGQMRMARRKSRRRLMVLPGRVTLIGGDSGAGKSTLLRQTIARLRAAGWRVVEVGAVELDSTRPVVETFGALPLSRVLELLSRAGLAEAGVLLRPAGRLSEGEKFRYRLARAMAEAGAKSEVRSMKSERGQTRSAVIVCDEFAAVLDRVTARVVAFGLRKWITGTNVAALVATSHDDLAEDLDAVEVRV